MLEYRAEKTRTVTDFLDDEKTKKRIMISDQRNGECFCNKLPSKLALKMYKTSAKVDRKLKCS